MNSLIECNIPWGEILSKADNGDKYGNDIYGASGRRLRYRVKEYFYSGDPRVVISVNDDLIPELGLKATASEIYGDFSLALHTKGFGRYPNEKHPDFHARLFVEDALTIFGKRWNIFPTHFIGDWDSSTSRSLPSDNYVQFNESLKQTKDCAQAAKNTWSGGVVGSLGFNDIKPQDVRIESRRVIPIFWKKR